jgi:hypothetical protein
MLIDTYENFLLRNGCKQSDLDAGIVDERAARLHEEMIQRAPVIQMPDAGEFTHEIHFQRKLFADQARAFSKLGHTHMTIISHCEHTGESLTWADMLHRYALLLHVTHERWDEEKGTFV